MIADTCRHHIKIRGKILIHLFTAYKIYALFFIEKKTSSQIKKILRMKFPSFGRKKSKARHTSPVQQLVLSTQNIGRAHSLTDLT